jgi:hypothetical protein
MISLALLKPAERLPNYVQDVSTSTCLFCPYGAEVHAGDRVYAFDEKTSFRRRQRERLVEVTAVKAFRSTGRVITLDLKIATPEELAKIAEDSEIPVESMLEHRPGNPTFDAGREPVVIYFRPCKEDDTIGAQFNLHSKRRR